MLRSLIALSLLTLPTIALAHPGHGTTPQDATHWIEPVHSIPVAAAILIMIAFVCVWTGKVATQKAERAE